MRSRLFRSIATAFSGLILSCWTLPACHAAEDLPRAIKIATYNQWEQSYHLVAEDPNLMAVVVPSIGGRVAFYGPLGDNVLFDPPAVAGKTMATLERGMFGGYQCDIGPELGNIPAHPKLWTGVYSARVTGDYSVRMTSPEDGELGVQIEKEFLIDPDTGNLGLLQTLRNVSDKEIQYCLWDRTLCVPGGFAVIPLNKKSRFPAKWSIRTGEPGKWNYDGVTPSTFNAKVIDGMLVAEARGGATKVDADSDAGWIAYIKGTLMFIKYFPYDPKGRYTDGGNSVEFYWDESVAELEPLSPQVTLPPKGSYTFPEKWEVVRLKEPVTTPKEARKAVKKIQSYRFPTP